MSTLADCVADYCSSEHFLFLDGALKEHAEPLLHQWAESVGTDLSVASADRALAAMAGLDLPLDIRKAVPRLVAAFLDYGESSGRFPAAGELSRHVKQSDAGYVARFRADGSVKGETFEKRYTDVGRNDPCPCGSGKKFKKCCMNLIA